MKPLHPILTRAFALAKTEIAPASPDLEERVLGDWKNARPLKNPDSLRDLRVAFFVALTVLVLTCAISAPILSRAQEDSSVVLANSALHIGLIHENL